MIRSKEMDLKVVNPQIIQAVIICIFLVFAGCNGLEGGTSGPSETPIATETETSTPTETATPTVAPTSTPAPENWSKQRKYSWFARDYYEYTDRYINSNSYEVENNTLHFGYIMEAPENKSVVRNESAQILVRYADLMDQYDVKRNQLDSSWAPRTVNVTALHPNDREVYFHSQTNATMANKYRNDRISYPHYFVDYLSKQTLGPAHPNHEG